MAEQLFAGRSPRVWLRLEQHDDKAFYANVPEIGDGFVLNANLAESSAASCATFLDRMARPFSIDPVSYRLGNPEWLFADRGAGREKKNYASMWRKFARGIQDWSGEPLADNATMASLRDPDVAMLARNTIDFQDRQLRDAWLSDAQQFVGMDSLFGTFAPSVYTAPYIVLRQGDLAARSFAIRAATFVADLAKPRPSQAVLAMDPQFLDDSAAVSALSLEIAASGVRAAWLWTIGMSTLALGDRPIRFTNYVRLVKTLTDAGIEVGVLYGGYLAAILRFVGVRAISHGLMYGEVRGETPAGGGPVASFYWPPLHRFLAYDRASSLAAEMSAAEFLERVCSCDMCRFLVEQPGGLTAYFKAQRPGKATRDFPIRSSLELNRFHFLMARAEEVANLRTSLLPDVIDQLLRAADEYSDSLRGPLRAWVARLEVA